MLSEFRLFIHFCRK